VTENHFGGVAVKNRSRNIKIFGIKGKVSRSGLGIEHAFIQADSGCTLPELSEFSQKQGLTGFEILSSVGSIGGSLLSDNVIREKTDKVEIVTGDNQTEMIDLEKLKSKNIVISVVFKLKAKV
jgi:UDP-N-acetylenolpyruvoylglucosamine reductase